MPAPQPSKRSPKAGRPPEAPISSDRVRRRAKTAHVTFRKGGMLSQAAEGPRVTWGVQKPKVKKG
jgi:hypothetical protein